MSPPVANSLVEPSETVARLTLSVRTDTDRVAAFKRETFNNFSDVPLTFPFCWLALPAVRTHIATMIGPAHLPLHESQDFFVEHALSLDTDYLFHVEFKRLENPSRLSIHAKVFDQAGNVQGRLETLLRVLPLAVEAA